MGHSNACSGSDTIRELSTCSTLSALSLYMAFGLSLAHSRRATQTDAMSCGVDPLAAMYRRWISAPTPLKDSPDAFSHSRGIPLAVSMSIISLTGAEPHFSACRMSTLCACPLLIRLIAERTVLSLVDPPEWNMTLLLARPCRPSSSTTREKTRSAWSAPECRQGMSRIVSMSGMASPASRTAATATSTRPPMNPRSGKRRQGGDFLAFEERDDRVAEKPGQGDLADGEAERQRPVRDPAAEPGALAIFLVDVQRVVVTGQAGEDGDVRDIDRPPGGDHRVADREVLEILARPIKFAGHVPT